MNSKNRFFSAVTALTGTVFLLRIYENISVASHVLVNKPWRFELIGLVYDLWLCLGWSTLMMLIFFLLSRLNKRLAIGTLHLLNIIFITSYIALLIVFSERNAPFDHEFFTRSSKDSAETVKQMMTTGPGLYIPFIIYLPLYFIAYRLLQSRMNVSRQVVITAALLGVTAICTFRFSNPSVAWFSQKTSYYLASNKLTYWIQDSYSFLTSHKEHLSNAALEKEIDFYQQNQPFEFTSKEYPLLHKDEDKDVLGSFFNLQKTPPNIVILVVEGLSRDFSGDNAFAGSFTPFLDSLSHKSLCWDNFLSTAPGTFAAQPAISGSVPYGKKGFSIMNVMPENYSLIKLMKQNGYYTSFMVGFNTDFDNMGGYIRQQGTDFILNRFPPKYKEMGIGEEGWSMGYPDDALFSRSLEVLDSIQQKPYLSIYHTATTHMPYLFEQKPEYDKRFDKKLQGMHATPQVKKILRETKNVLVTFMFGDDCLKKFFVDYSRRPEYSNTIFFITGDHHIGSFPITCEIDDYHVPLIVYSPMLKAPKKFYSVNSHNNIAPTIMNLLTKNYHLSNVPSEVPWLGSVLDTAQQFRNIHSMPFMLWDRDIDHYIYKEYFLSGDQLFKLTPKLMEIEIKNDSLRDHMIRLRENFKRINDYVCEQNKVFPLQPLQSLPGEKILLKEFRDASVKTWFANSSDTSVSGLYKIPAGYKYLYIETGGDVFLPSLSTDFHPTFRYALIDNYSNGYNYLYWSKRDIATLSKKDFVPKQWNTVNMADMFSLDDYKKVKDLNFELAIYTDSLPINLKLRNLDVKVYGIK
jgi:phosphoglycerol transferase MdoB-like AlkP superfamily enzyme